MFQFENGVRKIKVSKLTGKIQTILIKVKMTEMTLVGNETC